MKKADRFYDLSSLTYLGFCLIINVPITTSVMPYNRSKLRYFVLSIIILVGTFVFAIVSELNIRFIIDDMNGLLDFSDYM